MIITKTKLIRRTLLSTTLLGGAFISSAAAAEDAAAQVEPEVIAASAAAAAEAPEEAIVVTGSRLRRDSNLDSPSPVVSITADSFRGEQEVADALRTIPALSASVSSAQSVAPSETGGGGAVGSATLNLRGLGAERTLVLVNGRRHVAGVAETSVVDINSIPSSLINH